MELRENSNNAENQKSSGKKKSLPASTMNATLGAAAQIARAASAISGGLISSRTKVNN